MSRKQEGREELVWKLPEITPSTELPSAHGSQGRVCIWQLWLLHLKKDQNRARGGTEKYNERIQGKEHYSRKRIILTLGNCGYQIKTEKFHKNLF